MHRIFVCSDAILGLEHKLALPAEQRSINQLSTQAMIIVVGQHLQAYITDS